MKNFGEPMHAKCCALSFMLFLWGVGESRFGAIIRFCDASMLRAPGSLRTYGLCKVNKRTAKKGLHCKMRTIYHSPCWELKHKLNYAATIYN
jgi:hypothetical protein